MDDDKRDVGDVLSISAFYLFPIPSTVIMDSAHRQCGNEFRMLLVPLAEPVHPQIVLKILSEFLKASLGYGCQFMLGC